MRKSRKRQRLSRENHHRLRVISGLVFEMPLGVRRGKKNEYTTAATRPLMRVQDGSFFSKQSGTARLSLCARIAQGRLFASYLILGCRPVGKYPGKVDLCQ